MVSRGQLIEIGGSFRIPEVMSRSGAILREVGTTNKTHLRDYENALSDRTALLLKVHTSNFRLLGFTSEVPLEQLVGLGRTHQLPVMEDLGSGSLLDLSPFGLEKEPTVPEAVRSGRTWSPSAAINSWEAPRPGLSSVIINGLNSFAGIPSTGRCGSTNSP